MSEQTIAAERRNKDTVRTVAGVRTDPSHWANTPIHSFRTWTGDRTLVTWCGIPIDLAAGAFQTTDTVTCLQCGEASFQATQRMLRPTP